jgi:hypothetical protein
VVPAVQSGSVDLRGDLGEWLAPKRHERNVAIACGQDVPASRVARFRDSLRAQTATGWGVVVIEDGGARVSADVVRHQQLTNADLGFLATQIDGSMVHGCLLSMRFKRVPG